MFRRIGEKYRTILPRRHFLVYFPSLRSIFLTFTLGGLFLGLILLGLYQVFPNLSGNGVTLCFIFIIAQVGINGFIPVFKLAIHFIAKHGVIKHYSSKKDSAQNFSKGYKDEVCVIKTKNTLHFPEDPDLKSSSRPSFQYQHLDKRLSHPMQSPALNTNTIIKALGAAIITLIGLQYGVGIYFILPQEFMPRTADSYPQFLSLTAADIAALPTDDTGRRYAIFWACNMSYLRVQMRDILDPEAMEIAPISFGRMDGPLWERQNYLCYPGAVNSFVLNLPVEEWGEICDPDTATLYNVTIDSEFSAAFEWISIQPVVIAVAEGIIDGSDPGKKQLTVEFTAGGPLSLLIWGQILNFGTTFIVLDEGTPEQVILKNVNYETSIDLPCMEVAFGSGGHEAFRFDVSVTPGSHHLTIRTISETDMSEVQMMVLNDATNADGDPLDDVEEILLGDTIEGPSVYFANYYGWQKETEPDYQGVELGVNNEDSFWVAGEITFFIPTAQAIFGLPLELTLECYGGLYTNFSLNGDSSLFQNITLAGFSTDSVVPVTIVNEYGEEEEVPARNLVNQSSFFVGTLTQGVHTLRYIRKEDTTIDPLLCLFVDGDLIMIISEEQVPNPYTDTDLDSSPDEFDPSIFSYVPIEVNTLTQFAIPVDSSGIKDYELLFTFNRPPSPFDRTTNSTLLWHKDEQYSTNVEIRPFLRVWGPGDSGQDDPLGWWGESRDYWNSIYDLAAYLGQPEGTAREINSHSIVAIDAHGQDHYNYVTKTFDWIYRPPDPLPTVEDDALSYYYLQAIDAGSDSWSAVINYARDNQALSDGCLNFAFDLVFGVVEISNTTQEVSLLGLYDLECPLNLTSLTLKGYSHTNYVVGAPGNYADSQVLYAFCQNPNLLVQVGDGVTSRGINGFDGELRNAVIGYGLDVPYLNSYHYSSDDPSTWGYVERAICDYNRVYYNIFEDFSTLPEGEFPAQWNQSRTGANTQTSTGVIDSLWGKEKVLAFYDRNTAVDAEVSAWAPIPEMRAASIEFNLTIGTSADLFQFALQREGERIPALPFVIAKSLETGKYVFGIWRGDDHWNFPSVSEIVPDTFHKVRIDYDLDKGSYGSFNFTFDGNRIVTDWMLYPYISTLLAPNCLNFTTAKLPTDSIPPASTSCFAAIDDLNITATRASLVDREACVTYFSTTEESQDVLYKIMEKYLYDSSIGEQFAFYPNNCFSNMVPASFLPEGSCGTWTEISGDLEIVRNKGERANIVNLEGTSTKCSRQAPRVSNNGTITLALRPSAMTDVVIQLQDHYRNPVIQLRIQKGKLEYLDKTDSGSLIWSSICDVWDEWFILQASFDACGGVTEDEWDLVVGGVLNAMKTGMKFIPDTDISGIEWITVTKSGNGDCLIDGIEFDWEQSPPSVTDIRSFQMFHYGDNTLRRAWYVINDNYNGVYGIDDPELQGEESIDYQNGWNSALHEIEVMDVEIPLQARLKRVDDMSAGSRFYTSSYLAITFGVAESLSTGQWPGDSQLMWTPSIEIPDGVTYKYKATLEMSDTILGKSGIPTVILEDNLGDIQTIWEDNRIREVDPWISLHQRHSEAPLSGFYKYWKGIEAQRLNIVKLYTMMKDLLFRFQNAPEGSFLRLLFDNFLLIRPNKLDSTFQDFYKLRWEYGEDAGLYYDKVKGITSVGIINFRQTLYLCQQFLRAERGLTNLLSAPLDTVIDSDGQVLPISANELRVAVYDATTNSYSIRGRSTWLVDSNVIIDSEAWNLYYDELRVSSLWAKIVEQWGYDDEGNKVESHWDGDRLLPPEPGWLRQDVVDDMHVKYFSALELHQEDDSEKFLRPLSDAYLKEMPEPVTLILKTDFWRWAIFAKDPQTAITRNIKKNRMFNAFHALLSEDYPGPLVIDDQPIASLGEFRSKLDELAAKGLIAPERVQAVYESLKFGGVATLNIAGKEFHICIGKYKDVAPENGWGDDVVVTPMAIALGKDLPMEAAHRHWRSAKNGAFLWYNMIRSYVDLALMTRSLREKALWVLNPDTNQLSDLDKLTLIDGKEFPDLPWLETAKIWQSLADSLEKVNIQTADGETTQYRFTKGDMGTLEIVGDLLWKYLRVDSSPGDSALGLKALTRPDNKIQSYDPPRNIGRMSLTSDSYDIIQTAFGKAYMEVWGHNPWEIDPDGKRPRGSTAEQWNVAFKKLSIGNFDPNIEVEEIGDNAVFDYLKLFVALTQFVGTTVARYQGTLRTMKGIVNSFVAFKVFGLIMETLTQNGQYELVWSIPENYDPYTGSFAFKRINPGSEAEIKLPRELAFCNQLKSIITNWDTIPEATFANQKLKDMIFESIKDVTDSVSFFKNLLKMIGCHSDYIESVFSQWVYGGKAFMNPPIPFVGAERRNVLFTELVEKLPSEIPDADLRIICANGRNFWGSFFKDALMIKGDRRKYHYNNIDEFRIIGPDPNVVVRVEGKNIIIFDKTGTIELARAFSSEEQIECVQGGTPKIVHMIFTDLFNKWYEDTVPTRGGQTQASINRHRQKFLKEVYSRLFFDSDAEVSPRVEEFLKELQIQSKNVARKSLGTTPTGDSPKAATIKAMLGSGELTTHNIVVSADDIDPNFGCPLGTLLLFKFPAFNEKYFTVIVNGKNVVDLKTIVNVGDEVLILPKIAGGAEVGVAEDYGNKLNTASGKSSFSTKFEEFLGTFLYQFQLEALRRKPMSEWSEDEYKLWIMARFGPWDRTACAILATCLLLSSTIREYTSEDSDLFTKVWATTASAALITMQWYGVAKAWRYAANPMRYAQAEVAEVPLFKRLFGKWGIGLLIDIVTDIPQMYRYANDLQELGYTPEQAWEAAAWRWVPEWIIEECLDIVVDLIIEAAGTAIGGIEGAIMGSSTFGLFEGMIIAYFATEIVNLYIWYMNSIQPNQVSFTFDTENTILDCTPAIVRHGGMRVGDEFIYSCAFKNAGLNSFWYRQRAAVGPSNMGLDDPAWNKAQHYTLSANAMWIFDGFHEDPSQHQAWMGSFENWRDWSPSWEQGIENRAYLDLDMLMPDDPNAFWESGLDAWAGSSNGLWGYESGLNKDLYGRYWPDETLDISDAEVDTDGRNYESANWDVFVHKMPVLMPTTALNLYTLDEIDYWWNSYNPPSTRITDIPQESHTFLIGDNNEDGYFDFLLNERPVRVLESTLSGFIAACEPLPTKVDVMAVLRNYSQAAYSFKFKDAAEALKKASALAQERAIFDEDTLMTITERSIDPAACWNPQYTRFDASIGKSGDWETSSLPDFARENYYIFQNSSRVEWVNLFATPALFPTIDAGWRALQPGLGIIYKQPFDEANGAAVPLDWTEVTSDPECDVQIWDNELQLKDNSDPGIAVATKDFGCLYGGTISWRMRLNFTRTYPIEAHQNQYRYEVSAGLAWGPANDYSPVYDLGIVSLLWDTGIGRIIFNGIQVGTFNLIEWEEERSNEQNDDWWDIFSPYNIYFDSGYVSVSLKIDTTRNQGNFYMNGVHQCTFSLNGMIPTHFVTRTNKVYGGGNYQTYFGYIDALNVTGDDWTLGQLQGFGLTNPSGTILIPKRYVAEAANYLAIISDCENRLNSLPLQTNIGIHNNWEGKEIVLNAGETFSSSFEFDIEGPDNPQVEWLIEGSPGLRIWSNAGTTPLQSLDGVRIEFTIEASRDMVAGVYQLIIALILRDGPNAGNITYFTETNVRIRYNTSLSVEFYSTSAMIFGQTVTIGKILNDGSIPRYLLISEDQYSQNLTALSADRYLQVGAFEFVGTTSGFAIKSGTGHISCWDSSLVINGPTGVFGTIVTADIAVSLRPGDRVLVRYQKVCAGTASLQIGGSEFVLDGDGWQTRTFVLTTFEDLACIGLFADISYGSVYMDYIRLEASLDRYLPLAQFAFPFDMDIPDPYGWSISFGSGKDVIQFPVAVTEASYVDTNLPSTTFGSSASILVGNNGANMAVFQIPQAPVEMGLYSDFGSIHRYLLLRPSSALELKNITVWGCENFTESSITWESALEIGNYWLDNASIAGSAFGTSFANFFAWDISEVTSDYICLQAIGFEETFEFVSDDGLAGYRPFVVYAMQKCGMEGGSMVVQNYNIVSESFTTTFVFDNPDQNITLVADDKIWLGFQTTCISDITLSLICPTNPSLGSSFVISSNGEDQHGFITKEYLVTAPYLNISKIQFSGVLGLGQNFCLAYLSLYRYQPLGAAFSNATIQGWYAETVSLADLEGYNPVYRAVFDSSLDGFSSSSGSIECIKDVTSAAFVDSSVSTTCLNGETLLISHAAGIADFNQTTYFQMPDIPFYFTSGSSGYASFRVISNSMLEPLWLCEAASFDEQYLCWANRTGAIYMRDVQVPIGEYPKTWIIGNDLLPRQYYALKPSAEGETVLASDENPAGIHATYTMPKVGTLSGVLVLQTDQGTPEIVSASVSLNPQLVSKGTRLRIRYNASIGFTIKASGSGELFQTITLPAGYWGERVIDLKDIGSVASLQILAELIAGESVLIDYVVLEQTSSIMASECAEGHRDVLILNDETGHVLCSEYDVQTAESYSGIDFWVYVPGTNASFTVSFLDQANEEAFALDLSEHMLAAVNFTNVISLATLYSGWVHFSVAWDASEGMHNYTIRLWNESAIYTNYTSGAGILRFSDLVNCIAKVRFATSPCRSTPYYLDAIAEYGFNEYVSTSNYKPLNASGSEYFTRLDPGSMLDLKLTAPPRLWSTAPGAHSIYLSVFDAQTGGLLGLLSQDIVIPEFYDIAFQNLTITEKNVDIDIGEEPSFVISLRLQNWGNVRQEFALDIIGLRGDANYWFEGTGITAIFNGPNFITLDPGEKSEFLFRVTQIGYNTHIMYLTATSFNAYAEIPCYICTNYPPTWDSLPPEEIGYLIDLALPPMTRTLSYRWIDKTVTPGAASYSLTLNGVEIQNSTWSPGETDFSANFVWDISSLFVGEYHYVFSVTDGRRELITSATSVYIYDDYPHVNRPADINFEVNRTTQVMLTWNIYDQQAITPTCNVTIDNTPYLTEVPWAWDAETQVGYIPIDVNALNLPPREAPYEFNLTAWDTDVASACTDIVYVSAYNEQPTIRSLYDFPTIYTEWGDLFIVGWTFEDDSYGGTPSYRIYLNGELVREEFLPWWGTYVTSSSASYVDWTQSLGEVNQWYTFRFEFNDGLGFNSISYDETRVWVGNPPPRVTVDTPLVCYEYNTGAGVTLQWTPSDTYVFDPTYTVYVDYLDTTGFHPFTGAGASGIWSSGVPIVVDVSGLDYGNYRFALEISDGCGGLLPKEDERTYCRVEVYNVAPHFDSMPSSFVEYAFGELAPMLTWTFTDQSVLHGTWAVSGGNKNLSGIFDPGTFSISVPLAELDLTPDPFGYPYKDYGVTLTIRDGFDVDGVSVGFTTVRVWNMAPAFISMPNDYSVCDGTEVTLTWQFQDSSVVNGYWRISPPSGILVRDGYWDSGTITAAITATLRTDNPYTPKQFTFTIEVYDGFEGSRYSVSSVVTDEVTITVRGDTFDGSKSGWGIIKYNGQTDGGHEISGIPYLSGGHLCMEVGPHGYNRGYASIYYTSTPVSHVHGNYFGIMTCTDYSSGFLDYTAEGIELGAFSGSTDVKRYLSFMVGDDTTSHFIMIDALTTDGTQTSYYRKNIGNYQHVWLYMTAYYDTANEIRNINFYYSTDGSSWTQLYTLGYYYWCAPSYSQYIGVSAVDWDGFVFASHFTGKFDLFATFPDRYGGFIF